MKCIDARTAHRKISIEFKIQDLTPFPWPTTRGQRCWVHKTANVLNKLPKSLQAKAKRALHEIWMAETKADAEAALGAFAETYGVKYDKAVECLIKDRQAMLAFYDFPAEHWKHLRTSNPIESTLPPCAIEPCERRDACPTKPRSP